MYALYVVLTVISIFVLIFSTMFALLEERTPNVLSFMLPSLAIIISMAVNSSYDTTIEKYSIPSSYVVNTDAGMVHFQVNGVTYSSGQVVHYRNPEDTVLLVKERTVGKWIKDFRVSEGVLVKKPVEIP